MGISQDFDKQHNVWRSLLKGQAKDRFTALCNAITVEQGLKTDPALMYNQEQILSATLNGVAKHIFTNWQHAVRNQKQYMQHALSMGSMEPGAFCERLQKMSRYLQYFPSHNPLIAPAPFAEDELLNIVGLAVPAEWSITMLTTNQGIETFHTMEEAVVYFKQLYQADQLRKQLVQATKANESGKPNNKKRAGDFNKKPEPKKVLAKCPHCNKMGTHKPEECRANPKNSDNRSEKNENTNKFNKTKSSKPAAAATINAMHAQPENRFEFGSGSDFEENLDEFLAKLHEE
jgi:hypothetical protein